MSQPLRATGPRIGEVTQPFTRSEIERMRRDKHDGVRRFVIRVDLEPFARFGESGTPAGMIASDGAESRLVVGSCDVRAAEVVEVIVEQPDWEPAANDTDTDTEEDIPIARVGPHAWRHTQAEVAAVPIHVEDQPTDELELPDDEDDVHAARRLRARRVVLALVLVLALALAGLLAAFVLGRPPARAHAAGPNTSRLATTGHSAIELEKPWACCFSS